MAFDIYEQYGIKYRVGRSVRNNFGDLNSQNVLNILFKRNGKENTMALFLIEEIFGVDAFLNSLADVTGDTIEVLEKKYWRKRKEIQDKDLLLTGAETIALLLLSWGVKYSICYPGTSELALCEAICRCPDISLVNGRGDSESAFCAAGANLIPEEEQCVCILHGARGLTNATGAIADIRRNEIGVLMIVGLPSVHSERFLPPHGENGLMEGVGFFGKYQTDFRPEKLDEYGAEKWIKEIDKCWEMTKSMPKGPVLMGIPQNISEECWVPFLVLRKHMALRRQTNDTVDVLGNISQELTQRAQDLLENSTRPIILFDDYLLKRQIKNELICVSDRLKIPVFQVWYKRGPMLFEELMECQGEYIMGHYDSECKVHRDLIHSADLLITIEDRNMYERVIGPLPACKKIIITSNLSMTKKNEYFTEDDLILEGDVVNVFKAIFKNISISQSGYRGIQSLKVSNTFRIQKYDYFWNALVSEVGNFLSKQKQPVLIDDSQMFGGFISRWYKCLPENVKVFGDHGAFVGSGIAYAAGVALANNSNDFVVATLGDQAFTNGLQGLICAAENQLKILYIVCNNGKSISLLKQENYNERLDNNNYDQNHLNRLLSNVEKLDYCSVAEAVGINSCRIDLTNIRIDNIENIKKKLSNILDKILEEGKTHLLELVVSSEFDIWTGVWNLTGLDEK